METIHPSLQFFTVTVLLTIAGILYWMTIENLNHLKSRFVLSVALSIILTAVGAWAVSVFIKAMSLKANQMSTPA